MLLHKKSDLYDILDKAGPSKTAVKSSTVRLFAVVVAVTCNVCLVVVRRRYRRRRCDHHLRCESKSAPNRSDRNGQERREETQFLRDVRPVEYLTGASCPFSDQCRR